MLTFINRCSYKLSYFHIEFNINVYGKWGEGDFGTRSKNGESYTNTKRDNLKNEDIVKMKLISKMKKTSKKDDLKNRDNRMG